MKRLILLGLAIVGASLIFASDAEACRFFRIRRCSANVQTQTNCQPQVNVQGAPAQNTAPPAPKGPAKLPRKTPA